MFKTYHFEFPLNIGGLYQSAEFKSIEECVERCKLACEVYNVDYNSDEVKLFLTEDFGETYEECTEEGELAS